MLKGLKPPTHRVDAPGVFVFPHDDAWDHGRIQDERGELVAMAAAAKLDAALAAEAARLGVDPADLTPEARDKVAEAATLTDDERAEALASHPVARYFKGETRFQLDAPDHGPRGPACAADYLKPGAVPTAITLRRVPLRERALIEIEPDRFVRWCRWVRAGVARLATGGEVAWCASKPTDVLPDEWIESLADSDGGPAINLINLAGACSTFSGPLTSAEGKR